jgi:hypothetical protein
MMRNRVLAVGLAAALASFAAIGQQPGGVLPGATGKGSGANPENFEKVKAATLKNQQARIKIVQQTASCVQSADDFLQVRVCFQKEREAQKKMRDQMKGEMEAMRAERQQVRPVK